MAVYKDKVWLSIEYTQKEQTASEIAEKVGVSQQTILNWLERHSIPRFGGEGIHRKSKKKNYPTDCRNCGVTFYVDMPSKANPDNRGKFVRACSTECTSALKSENLRCY